MRISKRSRWTKRTGLLVMMMLVLLAVGVPARSAKAVLCGGGNTKGQTTYYSDASKTVVVGRYVWNDCAGTESLTGQQTQYATSFPVCC